VLDQAEYADGMSLYGFRYKECLENFTKFAFDERGKRIGHITPAHWKILFTDLFFSCDKFRPGNLLFTGAIFGKGTLPEHGEPLEKGHHSLEKANNMLEKTNSIDTPHSNSHHAPGKAVAPIIKANSKE
jgi:hypothetical protein